MSKIQNLWIASFNPGKLSEFKKLFFDQDFQLHLAKEVGSYSAPAETGQTFLDNAKIKAESLFKVLKSQEWVLAEDSGIMVDGLGGLPGIHSARYAGERASDTLNNDKLLKMLKLRSPLNRKAQFVSCIYVKGPGTDFHISGELKGQITQSPKGRDGFGYDPIFVPEGYEQTLAELGLAVKNKISHRAQACAQLKQRLQEI